MTEMSVHVHVLILVPCYFSWLKLWRHEVIIKDVDPVRRSGGMYILLRKDLAIKIDETNDYVFNLISIYGCQYK